MRNVFAEGSQIVYGREREVSLKVKKTCFLDFPIQLLVMNETLT